MRRFSLVVFVLCSVLSLAAQTEERHLTFTYHLVVRDVEPGKALRIWIPMPPTDSAQVVKLQSGEVDLQLHQRHETHFGNSMLYAYTTKADKREYNFTLNYVVVLRPHEPSRAAACDNVSLQIGEQEGDRIFVATGHNVLLNPEQNGPPLRAFTTPYVEIDGKPWNSTMVRILPGPSEERRLAGADTSGPAQVGRSLEAESVR